MNFDPSKTQPSLLLSYAHSPFQVLGQHNYRRYSLSLDGNILAFHLKLSDILNCSELMKPIINSGPKFVLRYSVNEYTRDQLFYQLLVRHYNEIMGLEYFPILDIIKGDLRFRKLPLMKTKHYPNSAKNCSRVLSALDYELSSTRPVCFGIWKSIRKKWRFIYYAWWNYGRR